MKAFFDRYKKHGKNPEMKALTPFKKWLIDVVAREESREAISQ
jgi:hypothetical protein